MNPITDDKQVAMARLIIMLGQLKVIKLRLHTLSHMVTMMGPLTGMIKPHWIPIPAIDVNQQFLEVIGTDNEDL